ncbi:Exodeoxyribonuclease 7 large subunit [subsurface metagenome]
MVHGSMDVYPPRGSYQLIVSWMEPKGMGALQLAFRQLMKKLEKEGLFREEIKKPLPPFPRKIGVVTSPTGAAIRDIINVIARRLPTVELYLFPSRVQGAEAAAEIAGAMDLLNEKRPDLDLIIIGRGGGSLEDLWPFNEEEVARAVAACPLPTLSAVGHETDITICDLVADLRAPTPSAAAELAVEDREGYLQFLDERVAAVERLLLRRLEDARRHLDQLRQRYAFRRPLVLIESWKEQLRQLAGGLRIGMTRLVERKTQTLEVAAAGLQALNPRSVLERGYTITTDDQTGQVVTGRSQLELRQALTLNFKDGAAGVEVTRLEES